MPKNLPSPDNKFLLYIVGTMGNFKKNVQAQLMSFYFINVETIGKYENCKKKFKLEKKNVNPANEFLLHPAEIKM